MMIMPSKHSLVLLAAALALAQAAATSAQQTSSLKLHGAPLALVRGLLGDPDTVISQGTGEPVIWHYEEGAGFGLFIAGERVSVYPIAKKRLLPEGFAPLQKPKDFAKAAEAALQRGDRWLVLSLLDQCVRTTGDRKCGLQLGSFASIEAARIQGRASTLTLQTLLSEYELQDSISCRFSKRRDPFLTTFSKPFPPLE